MKRILLFMLIVSQSIVYAQDTLTTLNEVVVSGIRASKMAPISEKTVNYVDISKTNQSFEPSNIISSTPNVTMSTDNGTPFGYTYLRIRGIDQSRVNMTLNGVPLNEPEDQGVFFSNLPNFMDNVESFQVQRGVGTSSNGVSSFAGSINFNTVDGSIKETSVKYNIGSYNALRVGGLYSSGLIKDKYSFSLNSNTFRTDGYKYGSGSRGYSFFMNGTYHGENSKLKLTALTGRSRNGMSWQGVSETEINNDPRTNYNDGDAWDNFSQSLVSLGYTKKKNNTTLFASVFYNKLEGAYDYDTNFFREEYGFGDGGSKNLFLNSDFYGVISNISNKSKYFNIDFGVSANSYTRKHRYSALETNRGFKNEVSSFLKTEFKYNKFRLFLDGQIRYANFTYNGDMELPNKVEWNFFNPKGGVSYSPSSISSIYYSVGLSHREPTRTNLFNGSDNLNSDYGFTNVKPERVVDHELGYKFFGDKLTSQVNLFYMDFTDEISLLGGTTGNGTLIAGSVDKSYRRGVELDFKYQFSDRLYTTYNEAYTDTKATYNGEEFNQILTPKTIRNIVLGYNNSGITVEGVYRHQSDSFIDISNENSIDKFDTFNVNIGYSQKNYSINLNIVNVTNQKFFTNGSMVTRDFSTSTTDRYLFVNAPTSLFLTFKYIL